MSGSAESGALPPVAVTDADSHDSGRGSSTAAESKPAASGKLESLPRDDLIKFIKKQTVLLTKTRATAEAVAEEKKELQAKLAAEVERANALDEDSHSAVAAYNAAQEAQAQAALKIEELEKQLEAARKGLQQQSSAQPGAAGKHREQALLEEIDCLKMQNTTLMETVRSLQTDFGRLSAERSDLVRELDGLRPSMLNSTSELQRVHAELSEYRSAADALRTQLAAVAAESTLRDEHASTSASRLESQLHSVRQELLHAQGEGAELSRQLELSHQLESELTAQLAAAVATADALQRQLDRQQQEQLEAAAEVEARLAATIAEHASLRQELQQQQSAAIDELDAKLQAALAKAEIAIAAEAQAVSQLRQVRAELDAAADTEARLHSAEAASAERESKLQAATAAASTELEVLRQRLTTAVQDLEVKVQHLETRLAATGCQLERHTTERQALEQLAAARELELRCTIERLEAESAENRRQLAEANDASNAQSVADLRQQLDELQQQLAERAADEACQQLSEALERSLQCERESTARCVQAEERLRLAQEGGTTREAELRAELEQRQADAASAERLAIGEAERLREQLSAALETRQCARDEAERLSIELGSSRMELEQSRARCAELLAALSEAQQQTQLLEQRHRQLQQEEEERRWQTKAANETDDHGRHVERLEFDVTCLREAEQSLRRQCSELSEEVQSLHQSEESLRRRIELLSEELSAARQATVLAESTAEKLHSDMAAELQRSRLSAEAAASAEAVATDRCECLAGELLKAHEAAEQAFADLISLRSAESNLRAERDRLVLEMRERLEREQGLESRLQVAGAERAEALLAASSTLRDRIAELEAVLESLRSGTAAEQRELAARCEQLAARLSDAEGAACREAERAERLAVELEQAQCDECARVEQCRRLEAELLADHERLERLQAECGSLAEQLQATRAAAAAADHCPTGNNEAGNEEQLAAMAGDRQALAGSRGTGMSRSHDSMQEAADGGHLAEVADSKYVDLEARCSKFKAIALKAKKEASELKKSYDQAVADVKRLAAEKAELAALLQSETDKFTSSRSELASALQSLQHTYESVHAALDAEQARRSDLEAIMSRSVRELAEAREQLAETIATRDALSRQLDTAMKRAAAAEASMLEQSSKLTASEKDRDALRRLLADAHRDADASTAVVRQAEEAAHAEEARLRSDAAAAHEQLRAARAELEQLRKTISKSSLMDLEIADYEKTVEAFQGRLQEKDAAIDSLQKDLNHAQQRIQSFESQLESSEAQRKQADERGDKLKLLYAKMRKELADAKELEVQLRSEEAALHTQAEAAKQREDACRLELTEALAARSTLEERIRSSADVQQRQAAAQELRMRRLQDDLAAAQERVAGLQSEYDGYKVRVHSVLKQQRSRSSAEAALEAEKESRAHLEAVVEQLRSKLAEASNSLQAVTSEHEALQDEHERLLARHSGYAHELREKEAQWRQRLEAASADAAQAAAQSEVAERTQRTAHADLLRRALDEQRHNLAAEHERELAARDVALSEADDERRRLQREARDLQRQLQAAASAAPQAKHQHSTAAPAFGNRSATPTGPSNHGDDSAGRTVATDADAAGSDALPGGYLPANVAAMLPREEGEGMEQPSFPAPQLLHQQLQLQLQHRHNFAGGPSPLSPAGTLVPFEQLLAADDNLSVRSLGSTVADDVALKPRLLSLEKQAEHLRELLNEAEIGNNHLREQSRVLKEEIRRLERNQERDSSIANLEYLKNVVLKFLSLKNGDEKVQLVPVLSTMLRFSQEECHKVECAARGSDIQSTAAGSTESPAATQRGWGAYIPRWTGLS